MSGQRSADSEGTAESVAAGCSLREVPRSRTELRPDLDGPLAVFTWGRGEDGQLGLGDTSDQDQPTYGTYTYCTAVSLLYALPQVRHRLISYGS
jgi:hypothetical protein